MPFGICTLCNEATLNEEGQICDDCLCWDGAWPLLCFPQKQKTQKHIELSIAQTILGFVCPREEPGRIRRHLLRRTLVGAPHTYSLLYNLFTYCDNEREGNISMYEDILNRIVVYTSD